VIIRCSWPWLIARLGGRFIDRDRRGVFAVSRDTIIMHCPNTGDVWSWRVIGNDER
jgi:hypothetical protein